jgi:hypothetical protein
MLVYAALALIYLVIGFFFASAQHSWIMEDSLLLFAARMAMWPITFLVGVSGIR